jgi:hypothetical protein
MRVKVCVDTARLSSLHQFNSLHDLVRETNLGKTDLFGNLSYP